MNQQEVINFISGLYTKELLNNQDLLGYLKKRGITKKDIERFNIGYIPPLFSANQMSLGFCLLGYLKEIKLVNEKGRDILSNRLIFPLKNLKGEIRGFQGRTISNNDAKFLNVFFDGKRTLFNEEALNFDKVLIVESPICAILSEKAGLSTVASLGVNGITREKLPMFSEKTVYIIFDRDTPGIEASKKLFLRLKGVSANPQIVCVPALGDKTDWADVILYSNFNKNILNQILQNSTNIVDISSDKIDTRTTMDGYDVREVIGAILPLKRKGQHFFAKCPFHSEGKERKNSMCVGGKLNIYYCFSCGSVGSATDFVMRFYRMSLKEAANKIQKIINQ